VQSSNRNPRARRTGASVFDVPGGNGAEGTERQAKNQRYYRLLPDILLLFEGQLHALELKNGTRGRVSPAQSEMPIALAKAGCRTAVTRSLDEALQVLEHWELIRGDGGRS
jgi:hypothetical protein